MTTQNVKDLEKMRRTSDGMTVLTQIVNGVELEDADESEVGDSTSFSRNQIFCCFSKKRGRKSERVNCGKCDIGEPIVVLNIWRSNPKVL